jgi:LemA protein
MLLTIIAIIAICVYIVMVYNTLIAMIEAVKNNQKQIDIQLDRRFKVFESLINVVKNYMDYEKSVLHDVVSLRSKAQDAHNAGDEQTRIGLENQISKIAGGINAVFEQYPDLKANQNAMQLQEEIVNTENKLAFAKQSLNDSIETYNAKKKSMIESIIVSLFKGKLDFDFPYWQISDEARDQQEKYTVKL